MSKNKKAEVAKSAATSSKGNPATFERTRAVAHLGIGTADLVGNAVSNIFTDYVLTCENPDPRIMLSAIGKRLNLESLKLRAAQLSQGKRSVGGSFFLHG